mmetsp:Transcript_13277/g.45936  ORF Transcript_13277/g.45936 Transcript_13277/m.45936 type:complete len:224 (-) Transcript_13277:652-1323(-)
MSNVRYAVLARLSDGMVASSYTSKRAAPETVETVKRVLTSGNLRPKTQLTVTVNDTVGALHLMGGTSDVLAVVTSASYPRRSAFKLLAELREVVSAEVAEGAVDAMTKENELRTLVSGGFREKCCQYDDLASVDKVTAVSAQVEDVKMQMEGNIGRMLENAENLSAVENKTEVLRAGAAQFSKRSEQVKRILWWRNVKVKMIVLLLVLCVLGYILVPIIIANT